jgi:branched-chain amino acid transport system ATP-binding protein
MTAGAAISCERLSKQFGGLRAVSGVDLNLDLGDRHVLIGPNGAGKTTLFNLLSGQLKPSAGAVRLLGRDVTSSASNRRAALGLARTFQITEVLRNLTVRDNVRLAVLARRRARLVFWRTSGSVREVGRQADDMLARWNLSDVAHLEARQLSYGKQRILELVMALANEPRVLLLDEPTAGLSVAEADAFVAAIKALPSDLTLLTIEHNLDVAFEIATEVTVMALGKIFLSGPTASIRRDPRVLELYIGSDDAGA